MIKTINLKANEETQINLTGGTHANIENFGDCAIYVSKNSSIVPETDGVMTILSGNSKVLRNVATYSIKDNEADYYGTIYVLADSDTKIQIETANDLNFKFVKKGGDGFTPIVSNAKFICECNQLDYAVDSYTEIVNIVTQPADCICAVGDTATFKVVATGNELVYQWQKQYASNEWKNIDDETSNTLSFEVKNIYFSVEMHFRCVVTDSYENQMISNSVKLIKEEEL